MANNDLEIIYEQLKDNYDLVLSEDNSILSGSAASGKFQLWEQDDGFFFEIEFAKGRRTLWSPLFGEKYYHCHPSSIEDAQECIIGFMKDTRKFFF